MEETKNEYEIELKFLIVYPHYWQKIYWDIFLIIILISSIILTPIDLAFSDIRDGDSNYNSFMYSIDIIFLCDLLVNFFSAYEDDKMILIDNRKKIISSYLKGWFSIDFLSIFPLDIILT